jgi:hypothetical protein
MSQDVKPVSGGGSKGHSGNQVVKSGANNKVPQLGPGKSMIKTVISPGRIVTPTGRGGRLKDGATSRITGNRMKARTWSGKKR